MAELLKVCFDEMMKSGNCSFEHLMEKMNDAGIDLDKWKQAFDGARLPQRMTKSTLAIQNTNLEKEIVMLRAKEHRHGYDKNKRTLANFDVERKNGNTILTPKTRLAEIILLNSTRDLKLSAPPSDYIEELEDKVAQLEEERLNLMRCNNDIYYQYLTLHTTSYCLQETNKWQEKMISRLQENEMVMSSEINDLKSMVRTLTRELNYEISFEDEPDTGYISDENSQVSEDDLSEQELDNDQQDENESSDEEIFEDLDDLINQYEQRQRLMERERILNELQAPDYDTETDDENEYAYNIEREHRH
ncbi:NSP3 [Rotavirus G chicken/03V0567/DEU/2003]|uniref:NSP3 n=1 Tax=Rotavirus G chicken/03V0567/DEU/2003 TaxID=994995 RepID=M4H258_9REOV|nr:NSP3 [Rotavirus G chicken/03V0567/DEU/2003]AFL91900.1 NSP3 [Rotavirus G chicken/03V0567/DEU/2003]